MKNYNKNHNKKYSTHKKRNEIQYECYNNHCVKGILNVGMFDSSWRLTNVLYKVLFPNPSKPSVSKLEICHFINNVLYGKSYYRPQSKFYAKAVVSPGDEFDEEIGKDIVKERIMKKYHRHCDKVFLQFLTKLRYMEAGIIHYCRKYEVNMDSVPSVESIEKKIYESGYEAGCKEIEF